MEGISPRDFAECETCLQVEVERPELAGTQVDVDAVEVFGEDEVWHIGGVRAIRLRLDFVHPPKHIEHVEQEVRRAACRVDDLQLTNRLPCPRGDIRLCLNRASVRV